MAANDIFLRRAGAGSERVQLAGNPRYNPLHAQFNALEKLIKRRFTNRHKKSSRHAILVKFPSKTLDRSQLIFASLEGGLVLVFVALWRAERHLGGIIGTPLGQAQKPGLGFMYLPHKASIFAKRFAEQEVCL